MRKIVHISDIHFGTADRAVVDRAIDKINVLKPGIVVVSGDLTQRARSVEFRQAKSFLDQLPKPQIVVPGNHDVPLYNVYNRFFRRLDNYRKYISDDMTPTFIDEEMAVIGINSARSFTIKGGRINNQQVRYIRSKMCDLGENVLKVIVSHHPFDLPEGHVGNDIVGRAHQIMPMITDCGVDLFLSGHLHVSNIETTAKRYKLDNGHVALVIQAGTTASARVRGEAHSFNLLEYTSPILRVCRYECTTSAAGFVNVMHKDFLRSRHGWESI